MAQTEAGYIWATFAGLDVYILNNKEQTQSVVAVIYVYTFFFFSSPLLPIITARRSLRFTLVNVLSGFASI